MARWLLSVTMLLMFSACGGSDSPAPTPDLTGFWTGSYVSAEFAATNYAVEIHLTDQLDGLLTGSWRWATAADWPADSRVTGYAYPSNDGRTLVDLNLNRGGEVVCCVPLFGCFTLPRESFTVFGYYENGMVIDAEASHQFNCGGLSDTGKMTLTRQ